jgi:hypothetical protein
VLGGRGEDILPYIQREKYKYIFLCSEMWANKSLLHKVATQSGEFTLFGELFII